MIQFDFFGKLLIYCEQFTFTTQNYRYDCLEIRKNKIAEIDLHKFTKQYSSKKSFLKNTVGRKKNLKHYTLNLIKIIMSI